MSENLVVANRYVRAIYELATAQNCVGSVLGDLGKISDVILANKAQKALLIGQAVPVRIKRLFWELILKNLQLNKLTENLIEILLEHNRMDILPLVHKNYAKLVKDKEGVMTIELASAQPLDEKTKKEIAKELQNIFSKKIEVEEKSNAKLLGGFLISSGSMMLDCSLKGRLEKVKQGFNVKEL